MESITLNKLLLQLILFTLPSSAISDDTLPNLKNKESYLNIYHDDNQGTTNNSLDISKDKNGEFSFNLVTALRGKVCMINGNAMKVKEDIYRYSSNSCTLNFSIKQSWQSIEIYDADDACNINHCGTGGSIKNLTFEKK